MVKLVLILVMGGAFAGALDQPADPPLLIDSAPANPRLSTPRN